MEGNGSRAAAQHAIANRPSTTRRTNDRRPMPLATTRNNRRNNRPTINTSAAAAAAAGAAAAAARAAAANTRLISLPSLPPLPASPPPTVLSTAFRAGKLYETNLTDKISYTNLKTGKRYKLLDANPRLGIRINALLEELRMMKVRGEKIEDEGFIRYLVLLITEELSS
jgi:hypothetical protein